MGSKNFKCDECLRDFSVSYLWSKPKDVTCPYCGSKKVSEPQKGCGCSRQGQDNKGFTFT